MRNLPELGNPLRECAFLFFGINSWRKRCLRFPTCFVRQVFRPNQLGCPGSISPDRPRRPTWRAFSPSPMRSWCPATSFTTCNLAQGLDEWLIATPQVGMSFITILVGFLLLYLFEHRYNVNHRIACWSWVTKELLHLRLQGYPAEQLEGREALLQDRVLWRNLWCGFLAEVIRVCLILFTGNSKTWGWIVIFPIKVAIHGYTVYQYTQYTTFLHKPIWFILIHSFSFHEKQVFCWLATAGFSAKIDL